MTTDRLIALDLLVACIAAAAWFVAGAAAAARRPRIALVCGAAAVTATVGRAGSVLALAGSGWWFVQEKVVLALPLAGGTALAAVFLRSVVALLTAGFAAAAGLAATLLAGYPATWSTGAIAMAAVAGAAAVTWYATAEPPSPTRVGTAVAALAVGVAGVALVFVPAPAVDTGGGSGGHDPGGTPVSSLRGPDPAGWAGGAVRRYTLTARRATVTLASGRRVEAWTFDGQVPGPPITAEEGDLIEVTLRNADIAAGVTVHWHGYDVPSGEDGVPGLTQDPVLPGGQYVYRFPAMQVGTFWYHTHEVSDRGVRMGLYGPLVVTPRRSRPTGEDIIVPVHTFGGTVVLGNQDKAVRRTVAPGTPVRLRLINTDNDAHRFTLTGTPYRLVAVDGGELTDPGRLTHVGLRLAAGGRYDLVFQMPTTTVTLLVDDDRVGARLVLDGPFSTAAPETSGWPELDLTRYGTPAPTPFTGGGHFDRRFTLVLDRGLAITGGRPRYAHTVNGRAFPSVPEQLVRTGELVRFTVVNRGRDTHPWHLHGHHVLVLARNGRAPAGSPLWLDSFDVRPGEVWEVGFRATNPGLWMNHCHNLSHADRGMAVHLAYDGIADTFGGAHGG